MLMYAADQLLGDAAYIAHHLHWSLDSILDLEHRGDYQHFAHAAFFGCSENHAADSRIDRKPRQTPSQVRQFAPFVDRAQFE